MSTKLDALDVKALLKKNPKAERVFVSNRKKLGTRRPRAQKEYALGLPYERPALVASKDGARRDWDKLTK